MLKNKTHAVAAALMMGTALGASPASAQDGLGDHAAAWNLGFGGGWHSWRQDQNMSIDADAQADLLAQDSNSFVLMTGGRINELIRTPQEYGDGSGATFNLRWFDRALDKLVIERGLDARVHVLLYTPPAWIKNRQAGTLAETWEGQREITSTYIDSVMRYANDRVGGDPVILWDVVNEATGRNGSNMVDLPGFGSADFNNSVWFRASKFAGPSGTGKVPGPDFYKDALRQARAADANDILIVNEAIGNPLWDGLMEDYLTTLRWLKADPTVPLEGVGLQFHLSTYDTPSYDKLEAFIQDIADLGLDVYITELDVKTRAGSRLDGNPYDTAESRAELAAQADVYREVIRMVLRNPAVKDLGTWGWSDDATWYDQLEMMRKTEDFGFETKPAYDQVRWHLKNYPGAVPRPDHHFKFDRADDVNDRGFEKDATTFDVGLRATIGDTDSRLGGGSARFADAAGPRLTIEGALGEAMAEKATVAFWFKADELNGHQALFETGDATGLAVRLKGGVLEARIKGAEEDRNVSLQDIEAGRWYHLAVVVDGTSLALQLDGGDDWDVVSDGAALGAVALDGVAGVGMTRAGDVFGKRGDGHWFRGRIDDLRVYDGHALTPEMVDQLAELGQD